MGGVGGRISQTWLPASLTSLLLTLRNTIPETQKTAAGTAISSEEAVQMSNARVTKKIPSSQS